MARIITTLILVCLASGLGAQSYTDLLENARAAYQAREFALALTHYKSAFGTGDPSPDQMMEAVRVASLLEDRDEAFRLLNQAIDLGWMEIEETLDDPELFDLQRDDRWPETINRMLEVRHQSDSDLEAALIRDLQEIDSLNQLYRLQLQASGSETGWDTPEMRNLWMKQRLLDSLNLVRISEILNTYGYPEREVVGDLSEVPVQVVLNANHQVIEAFLPYFEAAVEDGQLPGSYLAEMVDKVRIGNGLEQLYGTQLIIDPENGDLRFAPIEDPADVNERRAAFGLEPIEDYAKRFGIKYKSKRRRRN